MASQQFSGIILSFYSEISQLEIIEIEPKYNQIHVKSKL